MFMIKQIILWTVIVIAFTPLAFILMPLIVVTGIIGAIAALIDRTLVHHSNAIA